jgi:hypothetical protein
LPWVVLKGKITKNMIERKNAEEERSVFRKEGDRMFLGRVEVFTSLRSLPEGNLLGFSCSEGDYFKSAETNEYFEVLRDFGDHVQKSHSGSGRVPGRDVEIRLERVYKAGTSRGVRR